MTIEKAIKAAAKGLRGVGKAQAKVYWDGIKLVFGNNERALELVVDRGYVVTHGAELPEGDSARSIDGFFFDFPSLSQLGFQALEEIGWVEFNNAPEGASGVLTAEDVGKLDWATLATDTEATRYALGGVLIDGDNVVATDGRRLHRGKLSHTFAASKERIIHQDSVAAIVALAKLFKEKSIVIVFRENTFLAMGARWKYSDRLVEGRFPNWERVASDFSGVCAGRFVVTKDAIEDCEKCIKTHNLGQKAGTINDDDVPIVTIQGWNQGLDARYVKDALKGLLGSAKTCEIEYTNDASGPYNFPRIGTSWGDCVYVGGLDGGDNRKAAVDKFIRATPLRGVLIEQ